jgi:hypothetical protein
MFIKPGQSQRCFLSVPLFLCVRQVFGRNRDQISAVRISSMSDAETPSTMVRFTMG